MLKKSLNILFTCVGRRVELIQSFIETAFDMNIQLCIIGVDNSEHAPALAFCNKIHLVCKILDSNYIPSLLRICSNENVDLVIPTIDTDLLLLSQNRLAFLELGTEVLISAEDKIQICRDKRLTSHFFTHCGLQTPKTIDNVLEYAEGYPCFIKPRDGSSSINTFKINSQEELYEIAEKVPQYIIQPFISGIEYTVDVFCDFNGAPLHIIPRKRLLMRSGEVLVSQIDRDRKIILECEKLIKAFKPRGPLTIQLIRNSEGVDYYIEINPRFGGGCPISIKSGDNIIKSLFSLLLETENVNNPNESLNGIVYSRFDQSVAMIRQDSIPNVNNYDELEICLNSLNVNALIFDLDDTLFSEKEYVKSGFQYICDNDSNLEGLFDRFWFHFNNGDPAIDSVLLEQGIYSLEYKLILLEMYQKHYPNISLFSGVHQLLINWRKDPNHKLGLITDGRPNGQNNKIDALGLRDLFDEIIITDDLAGKTGNVERFRKPNSLAFQIMRDRLNTNYYEMVYVGDNLKKDFQSPKKLGMHSIRFLSNDRVYD